MSMDPLLSTLFLGVIALHPAPGGAADDQDEARRLSTLEAKNAELEQRLDSLSNEFFRLDLGDVVPALGESRYGLGRGASKVYGKQQGVSIGGYGEALYRSFAGRTDEFDLLRAVLYVGYKFTPNWVLNSEIEFEHGGEEVAVEFLTLDYLWRPEVNARAGLVLIPMGFLNELHEPTTFLSAERPQTERRILPATWGETGAGVFGDAGPVAYRAYVVTGLDGSDFDAEGIRAGRQGGVESKAEDFAVVLRADWVDTPGILAGGSIYHGDAGQEQSGLGDTAVTVWELHGEAKWRGVWLRALVAMAAVDDVAELNAASGFVGDESVGEEMNGGYVEAAYDVMRLLCPESRIAVRPFVRWETVDTQADVPSGFSSSSANDFDLVTFGFQVQPIDQLVFKIDYQDWDEGDDRLSVSMGYVF